MTPPPSARRKLSGPPHLVLIGMMGSGKSSVGRALSNLTGRLFSDTDAMVEAYFRLPIAQIFQDQGEESFRQYEHEMIQLALNDERPGIISTGGGAVTSPINRKLIWDKAWTVYLEATPERLVHRIRQDGSRPLLQQGDPESILKNLLEQRGAYYRKAHWSIQVDHLSVREIAKTIWAEYRRLFGPPPRGTRKNRSAS